jgi:hypothetical protein
MFQRNLLAPQSEKIRQQQVAVMRQYTSLHNDTCHRTAIFTVTPKITPISATAPSYRRLICNTCKEKTRFVSSSAVGCKAGTTAEHPNLLDHVMYPHPLHARNTSEEFMASHLHVASLTESLLPMLCKITTHLPNTMACQM